MRNNLREGARREWEIWKRWARGEHVGVQAEHIRKGHLVLENDGHLIDLGPCSLEDLRLLAFVAQEAYIRLPSKRGRSKTTPGTLARVRNLTRAFWQASEDPARRTRSVFGRPSVAVGVDSVVAGSEKVLGAAHALDSVSPEA